MKNIFLINTKRAIMEKPLSSIYVQDNYLFIKSHKTINAIDISIFNDEAVSDKFRDYDKNIALLKKVLGKFYFRNEWLWSWR